MATLLSLPKGVPGAKAKSSGCKEKSPSFHPPSGKMNLVSYPVGSKPKLSAPTPMGSMPKKR